MKCPKCDGFGIVGLFTPNVEKCDRCNGTGETEQTNEEWLKSRNTEQLAEEISNLVFGGDFKKHISKMGYINMHSFQTEIVEWLKQPHREENEK